MTDTAGEPSGYEIRDGATWCAKHDTPPATFHCDACFREGQAALRAAAAGAAPGDAPQPKLICPECYSEKPCAKCVALGAAPASPAVREAAEIERLRSALIRILAKPWSQSGDIVLPNSPAEWALHAGTIARAALATEGRDTNSAETSNSSVGGASPAVREAAARPGLLAAAALYCEHCAAGVPVSRLNTTVPNQQWTHWPEGKPAKWCRVQRIQDALAALAAEGERRDS